MGNALFGRCKLGKYNTKELNLNKKQPERQLTVMLGHAAHYLYVRLSIHLYNIRPSIASNVSHHPIFFFKVRLTVVDSSVKSLRFRDQDRGFVFCVFGVWKTLLGYLCGTI